MVCVVYGIYFLNHQLRSGIYFLNHQLLSGMAYIVCRSLYGIYFLNPPITLISGYSMP